MKVQGLSYSLLGLGFRSRLRLRSRFPEQPRLVPALHAEQIREEIDHSRLQKVGQRKARREDG